jgi:rod shape-determining protein MreC
MFSRRPGPVAQLALWTVFSLMLIVVDARFQMLGWLRAGVATVLNPVQRTLRFPFDFGGEVAGFFTRHHVLLNENSALREAHRRDAALLARLQALQSENDSLRQLANLRHPPSYQPVAAEVLSTPRDPFSRRVVLDKGGNAAFKAGWPVVDNRGLVGQITRVYPMSSEVTLISDRDQVVPVQIQRTGQRVLVFGGGDYMEVRYLPTHTDIVAGDLLETSGIDRIYPAGLAVAKVIRVVRPVDNPYARVNCQPIAGVEKSRVLMVLMPTPEIAKP